MQNKLLGSLGKVAGLGGIALGVFLLLFQGVLQKQFLPQAGLSSAQAFAVIFALMILTYGIAAIGLVAWLVSRSTNPKAPIPPLSFVALAVLIALVLGAAVYVGAKASAGGSASSNAVGVASLRPQTSNPSIDLNQYPQKTCFDYSTNDGLIKLAQNAITFEIRFSKASNESIYVYKDGTNLRAIAHVKGANPGDHVDFSAFDSSSRVYSVSLGGYFIAQNVEGYFLLARILSIKDDTRGDTSDEVCFAYSIDTSKSGRFEAL